MKEYLKYNISTDPFEIDTISGLLWELDIDGLYEYDDYVEIYGDKEKLSETDVKDYLDELKEMAVINSFNLSSEVVENKNWNEEWEQNLNIIKPGEKIVIRPVYKEYNPAEGEIVINLEPKMSFGTGEHETTKLMVQMVERHIKKGDVVLDVGSGTGVLAIAAHKLGAKEAIAVDNDEWCLINGEENIEKNDCKRSVKFVLGEIKDIPESNFDVVLANINKHILLDIKEEFYDKTGDGKLTILSGLLDIDEEDILDAFTSLGFNLVEIEHMNEWISVVFQK
ncbi:MAG: hypothetical protein SCALA702_16280 [Melioribacteraceae bacterium]|nr:MAG: hypothetical protein SCALA702_16280 [Melioribacteraceae bacterium]